MAGLKNAQAKGVQLGRRKVVFDREAVRALARKGMSVRAIAKKLGLGNGKGLHRIIGAV